MLERKDRRGEAATRIHNVDACPTELDAMAGVPKSAGNLPRAAGIGGSI
jgi:hypothetical protein